jgi:hypothetical protein
MFWPVSGTFIEVLRVIRRDPIGGPVLGRPKLSLLCTICLASLVVPDGPPLPTPELSPEGPTCGASWRSDARPKR